MRKTLLLASIIIFFISGNVSAQYYDTGEDPSSLKWLQVKTGRFRVIYPEKYGRNGAEFARILEQSYPPLTGFFKPGKFRIPVVIHSFSTQSNGYVAWAPKRMELYPMPEQNSVPGNSDRQLAIHELTHVMQMESLNSGFTGALSYLFGEQSTGVASALLPLWFLEGDAVLAESVLSGSGRARSPSFQKELKAIAVTRGNYKYDKIVNGSFRNYVPDHYRSGYQMVAWAMAEHDPDIWRKVLKTTANEPFTLDPVNISLLHNERLTKKRLYNETFDTLSHIWQREASKARSYTPVNPEKKKRYISYYSPVSAGDRGILAVKTSLSDPPSFVLIDPAGKKEMTIYHPGNMYPYLLSYAAGRIAWVESTRDPRWANRDYSVVRTMEPGTGRKRTITKKTRYPAVTLSPDGKEICAVENTADNRNNLVFLDAFSGKVKKTIPSPENYFLQRPRWSEDGRITVIYLTEDGEGVMTYSTTTGSWETFLEAGKEDLHSCFLRNDTLFYISSGNGTDNVFFMKKGMKAVQLTMSKFGATDVNPSGNDLLFCDYGAQGNSVSILPASNFPGTLSGADSASFLINRIRKPAVQEPDSAAGYAPVPYRKWQHMFRFHSWMPFYADLGKIQSDPLAIRPGVTVMSQNTLSTLITTVGYEYSESKRNVFHTKLTWKGLYPVLESEYTYGDYPSVYGNPSAVRPGFSFTNTLSVPLQFSKGRFSQYLRPSVSSEYSNNVYQTGESTYDYYQLFLSGRIYFSNYARSAPRDIYPRWAQTVDLSYYFAPFDENIVAPSAVLRTSFYLPGLLPNNGIRIRFEKENKEKALYSVRNRIPYPRGYNRIFSRQMSLTTVDYVFPVAYPDLNIWSLLYLKRIRSSLFYDQASARNSRHYYPPNTIPSYYDVAQNEIFRSYGVELLADFHVFRMPFLVSGGVQSAWKNFSERPTVSLLFNIDLYGFSIGKNPNN